LVASCWFNAAVNFYITDELMRSPIFQIDAFTDRRFAGNPAAVMPMDGFPADAVLQAIA
jgi:hypothetical protein